MWLITEKTVRSFADQHADARQALSDWCAMVTVAHWTTPDELTRSVPTARPIANKRVVFNILSNNYRIICSIRYASERYGGQVRVEFIGTHAEYDKVDATTVTFRPSEP